MIVFCKAILGLLRGNDFKTPPVPYEFYYQTKRSLKNKFLKIRKWPKSLKLKSLKLKSLKLRWAKARELNYKLSKTF
ncbi:hypothetical protein BB403_04235 [Helicobacter pylori]|nr:hypothetical protein B0X67_02185 [Helicobacter pylori]PDX08067.1 hypothetical protein BB403_04235 [Helicobacter pylori]